MLDLLKILIRNTDLINELFDNPLLITISIKETNNKNYEVIPKEFNQAQYVKEYKGIYFCFYFKEGVFTKLEILLKPHYYFNNNLHNANDFTVVDCIETLTDIKDIFNLPIAELQIINIEFGVNGLSPINCKDLITHLLYHGKNLFINSSDDLRYSKISYRPNKYGKANEYKRIKFYAKGVQFPEQVNIDTFRFEVKGKQSKYIKTLGINTYADLLNIEIYANLSNEIKKEFSKVLIIDADNTMQNLTPKEQTKLFAYLNTTSWYKYLQGNRNQFSKHKKKYIALLDKTENNIHATLENIISQKLDDLLKRGADSIPPKKTKRGADSTVSIIGICTHLKNRNTNKIPQLKTARKCLVTGVNISVQKEGSILLSHTGLKQLFVLDRKQFDIIKNKYLPKKWIGSSFETQIKELAHNIRNKNSNLKRCYELRCVPNQIQMFS